MHNIDEHPRLSVMANVIVLVCAVAMATTWVADAMASRTILRAHSAHTQSVTDSAHLHYLRESGSDLLEEGKATGGLPGHVYVRINLGATVYGSFTISTSFGSISGSGSGKLHGTGRYASFGGSMTIIRGTGRYAHARGHGGFYGTIERDPPYSAVVQTTGTLAYP